MNPIPLSSIDSLFLGPAAYSIDFVFVFSGRLQAEPIRAALSEIAPRFAPAFSRLEATSPHSFAFSSKLAEPYFRERVLDSQVDLGSAESLSHALDTVESMPDSPLLKCVLSHCGDRSLLGLSMSHAVGDGYTYFALLLTALSRALRGEDFSIEVAHKRQELIAEATSVEINPEILFKNCGLSWTPRASRQSGRALLRWRRESLSLAEIKGFRASFIKDDRPDLSANALLVASLWKSFAERHRGPDTTLLSITCPVDFRRIYKDLSAGYMGNAINLAATRRPKHEVRSLSLQDLAHDVRKSIAAVNDLSIARSLSTLEAFRQETGLVGISELHVAHPKDGLLVTNLSRLPMRDLDFGAGPPIAIHSLSLTPGAAVVLPASGGFDIRICEAID